MINLLKKRVLFISLDDTLIKTISGKTFPEDVSDFKIQLAVLDKIAEKFPYLVYFFIVTNQEGIGKFINQSDFKAKLYSINLFCKYYLDSKLKNVLHFDEMYCCSTDKTDSYRKPNTGMLEKLVNYWEIITKEECIMIGIASGKPGDFSDSDKKCAENFGIDYIDVRDFLKL